MTEEIKGTTERRRRLILLGLSSGLLTFSASLTHAVLTDLIVYRTCLISLNINATDCLSLRLDAGSPKAMDLEAKVEPYASMIVMSKDLLKNILPTVVSLLLVPWSDRGGRRPILLAVLGGSTSSYVMLAFLSNWNISPWYLIVALIPSKLFGGVSVSRITSICYISDVTEEKDRTVQLTMLEAWICAGRVIGALTGSLIYEKYGYVHIFGTASLCCLSAFVSSYFFLPESVLDTSKESSRGFEGVSFVKGLFTTSSLSRTNFHRSLIWLTIFTLALNKLIDKGYKSVEFLFTRMRLGWNVQHYSYFFAANTAVRISGLCVASIRSLVSEISDTWLIFLGLLSALGGMVTKSLAWQSWHMYLALCIDMLGGITVPVIRSAISKFVPSHDTGKIFSLASLLQILSSLGGSPLYTLIYSHYLPPVYPSPVYLLSVGFYVLVILCVICVEILIRKYHASSNYVAAAQEDL